MTTQPQNTGDDSFRERLFDAERMNPSMRDAYRAELDRLTHETHTPRSRATAITFLVICIGVVLGEVWALSHYRSQGATFYIGAITMLVVCATAAVWLMRDLSRGRSVRRQSFRVADMFYGAAGILTVVTLMHGLAKASDPASTFNAFYVYVFLAVCAHWAIGNRIAAATIETREHLLRVESRLADLADRLPR